MASKRYEDKHAGDPNVKVTHRKDGCPIDGKRGTHEHTLDPHNPWKAQ